MGACSQMIPVGLMGSADRYRPHKSKNVISIKFFQNSVTLNRVIETEIKGKACRLQTGFSLFKKITVVSNLEFFRRYKIWIRIMTEKMLLSVSGEKIRILRDKTASWEVLQFLRG